MSDNMSKKQMCNQIFQRTTLLNEIKTHAWFDSEEVHYIKSKRNTMSIATELKHLKGLPKARNLSKLLDVG